MCRHLLPGYWEFANVIGSVRKLRPWRVQQNYFYQNHQHIFVARAIYGSLDLLKYLICCFGDTFFSEIQHFPCQEAYIRFFAFISTLRAWEIETHHCVRERVTARAGKLKLLSVHTIMTAAKRPKIFVFVLFSC